LLTHTRGEEERRGKSLIGAAHLGAPFWTGGEGVTCTSAIFSEIREKTRRRRRRGKKGKRVLSYGKMQNLGLLDVRGLLRDKEGRREKTKENQIQGMTGPQGSVRCCLRGSRQQRGRGETF